MGKAVIKYLYRKTVNDLKTACVKNDVYNTAYIGKLKTGLTNYNDKGCLLLKLAPNSIVSKLKLDFSYLEVCMSLIFRLIR